MNNDFTSDYAHARLIYYPKTGVLIWKPKVGTDRFVKTWNTKNAGNVAGTYGNKNGVPTYWVISIDGRNYKAHRLAWLMVTGDWPIEEVDHINEIKTDNRFENLREATHGDNKHNRGMMATNTSGSTGVHQVGNRWKAQIRVNGKVEYLGYSGTRYEAEAKYRKAAAEYHGEFIHESLLAE